MKRRTFDYFKKDKAIKILQHPGDLKSFLKAELDSCGSHVVKKHIKQTLKQFEDVTQPETADII